jgi:predicted esterase YcpF (UPF0227 family)
VVAGAATGGVGAVGVAAGGFLAHAAAPRLSTRQNVTNPAVRRNTRGDYRLE